MRQRFLRVLRTSRYLKVSQLYWFVRRRVMKQGAHHLAVPEHVSRRSWVWPVESSIEHSPALASITFDFLNVRRMYPLAAIAWAPNDVNRLWRYNLHYFDYLLDAHRSTAEKNYLIRDWIHNNPLGSEPAWEPYTASLRIVNWVKYLSQAQQSPAYADALQSLYRQVLWLERNLELHILANHYFENIKALLFAGVFFQGEDAQRWMTLALREISEQIREQVLRDGCHYERSPQYHCIILQGLLDIIELNECAAQLLPESFLTQVRTAAKQMAEFLADIVNPQGQYPLFNDAAFCAVQPMALLARAEKLLEPALPAVCAAASSEAPRIVEHHEAGFYGYRAGLDWLMIDCGAIGPQYQPGHTHCDFLTYELMIDGIPVVVDTGVLEYEPGAMRRYVRSTAAHNVVQIEDAEQSELWGEFRVARRAKKLGADIRRTSEGIVFEGRFEGFPTLGAYQHRRQLTIEIDKIGKPLAWKVNDRISGHGVKRLRSYIHLHPEITPIQQDECIALVYDGKTLAYWAVASQNDTMTITIEKTVYCPEFGKALDTHVLIVETQTGLPAELEYTIKRQTD